MANPEHLEILKQGVKAWNEWRGRHPNTVVGLNDADLRGASLGAVRLGGANLSGADLYMANLSGADLSDANLRGTDLRIAELNGANLRGANLLDTDFRGADLRGADVGGALTGGTIFTRVDLREVKALERVRHLGPSEISISTVSLSEGRIPEVFLRGCGVPESFVVHIPALVAAMQPIQFYSCFISYSSTDQEFAERLHSDLQAKGVRVWFAPRDMKIGARIRPTIDESIRVYDKLLLVLSEHSVGSHWVEQEVETALAKEEEAGREVLFPVRLDEAVMDVQAGWPALVKRTRHVGDFTRWKDHGPYRKAFDRLLRDLKAGA